MKTSYSNFILVLGIMVIIFGALMRILHYKMGILSSNITVGFGFIICTL